MTKEILLKQELEQQQRNMSNESKLNECETHIGRMNGYLLQIEKEIHENKITGKNKVTIKMVGYDDLKKDDDNYEFTMKENVCRLNEMFQYNTFVYNKNLGEHSDIIDIFDGNESSLRFRKQSKQKESNNNSNSKINVKRYEIYSFSVFGDVHTNDYETFANITHTSMISLNTSGNFYHKFDTIDEAQKMSQILALRQTKIFSFDSATMLKLVTY